MKVPKALATVCLFIVFAQSAEGGPTYRFGKEESLNKIRQTEIRDEDGKPLDLAYKVTTTYFFAGVSLHDDGYVLQSRDNRKAYYALSPEKIAEYQDSGLLPKPLPRYSISFFAYLMGYSLWLILAAVVCIMVWQSIRKPKAIPAAPTSSVALPAPAPPAQAPAATLPPSSPDKPFVAPASDSGCLETVLMWSAFLGFAGALGGSAAEGLWVLTALAGVLYPAELVLAFFWQPWGRRTIILRVINQICLWAIFVIAVRH